MIQGVPRHLIISKARKIFVNPLRDRSESIIKLWTDHCEFIFAHRVRRGQQLIAHYRRIWQEKELMRIWRLWMGHTKGFILASIPFAFDWNKERIATEVIQKQLNAIEYVHQLHDQTLLCCDCHLRKVIDRRVEGISYCMCRHGNGRATKVMDEWEPYLERDNIIIWRRPESGRNAGQFAFKVYGKYEDVTAEDFFFVQTDVHYRKVWDKSALTLDIVDTDLVQDSNSNVLYWELLWPKLFANRDFVFKRRSFIDKKNHLMVIVNQSTEHPSCPPLPKNQRVHDYWSYMVIKPKTTFRKPGLEFVVTYFDNPGIVMPPTITKWVSRIYMPDFLSKLHQATIRYATGKDLSLIRDERFNDDAEEEAEDLEALDYFWNICPDPGFEYPPDRDLKVRAQNGVKADGGGGDRSHRESVCLDRHQSESADQVEGDVAAEDEESQTEGKKGTRSSWWSYLHPYSYFA